MPDKSPLGDVILRAYSMSDDWVVQNAKERQLLTTCTLDAIALSERLEREADVLYSVARIYGFEPSPPANATRSAIRAYAGEVYNTLRAYTSPAFGGSRNLHIQINCENGPSYEQFYMYCDLMELAVKDFTPIGMVFSNAATGSFPSGNYGEPNYWATPAAMEYILTLDKYRKVRLKNGSYAFIHGTHAYTSQYPNMAVNGGETKGNPFGWRSPIVVDWTKPQDHLARDFQAIMVALRYQPKPGQWVMTAQTFKRSDGTPVEPPWFIVTEELIDDMQDVRNVHPDLVFYPPYDHPQGYNTMRRQWETVWYPGRSAGLTLADMRMWVWSNIYGPTGYYIGTHNFCMGDTGGWKSHNTLFGQGNPDVDYYSRIAEALYPVDRHFLEEITLAEIQCIIHTPAAEVNMRNAPASTGAILTVVPNNSEVTQFQGEMQNGWQKIRFNGYTGWVSLQNGKVTFTEVTTLPPIDPKDFAELKQLVLTVVDSVKTVEKALADNITTQTEAFEQILIQLQQHATEIDNLKGGGVPIVQVQSIINDLKLWSKAHFATQLHVQKSVKALINTNVSELIDGVFADPENQPKD